MTIRVHPGASRNEITERDDGTLLVRVTAPPVEGKANKAVIRMLADHYRVPKSQIEIIRGESGRDKVVRIA